MMHQLKIERMASLPLPALCHYGGQGRTPLTRPAKCFTTTRHTPTTRPLAVYRKEPDLLTTGRSVLATLSRTKSWQWWRDCRRRCQRKRGKERITRDRTLVNLIWIVVDYSAIYSCLGVCQYDGSWLHFFKVPMNYFSFFLSNNYGMVTHRKKHVSRKTSLLFSSADDSTNNVYIPSRQKQQPSHPEQTCVSVLAVIQCYLFERNSSSVTWQMQSSSIIFEKGQKSLELISPELSNSKQNNQDKQDYR